MGDFETAMRIEAQDGVTSSDHLDVVTRAGTVVVVAADGAGGTGGGARAAARVIERVTSAVEALGNLLEAREWKRLLEEIDRELLAEQVGQTTAVIVATDGSRLVGASVGDSAAWVIGATELRELTERQHRKPLLGNGPVEAEPFESSLEPADTLLVATDGLMKYARLDRLRDAVRRPERSLALACDELIELVRLPSGTLQDDVGVVLLSRRDDVGNRPEVLRFVEAARRLCDFVEHGRDLDSSTRLQRARSVLLELYAAGAELPFVDSPEDLEWPDRPGRPLWSGFGAPTHYWEVFDPYELGEPVVGDLDDDLLDVYFDVQRGLTLWESPLPKAGAVWAWRFLFDSHWGDHAIDALRALHRACREHG